MSGCGWENDDIEKQVFDQTLGRIKFVLVESGFDIRNATIVWKKQIVEIKCEEVATVQDNGTFEAKGDALKVKPAVDSFIAEWKK